MPVPSSDTSLASPDYDGAYQGAAGAFSEEAARALLGPDARLLPCPTLEATFDAVTVGRARAAVVPIENTLAGSIHRAYDLLLEDDLAIVGEVILRIDQALIAPPGMAFADVRRVMSHPVALAQCESFFRRHPQIEPLSVFDTAGAVETILRDGLRDAAAIASRRAAAMHGGVVLLERIQDHEANYTRFLRLTLPNISRSPDEAEKTTLVVTVQNAPGALVRILTPFADRALDLSRIESRPLRGAPFEYLFYLDVVAGATDPIMTEALAELQSRCRWMKMLGTYRKCPLPPGVGARPPD